MNFILLEQLGNTGKEGKTFKIKSKNKFYALKKFKKRKSKANILKEARFQHTASLSGISPKIYECNLDDKHIIMTKLDTNLFKILKDSKGKLSIKYQKEIVRIINSLDKINIFHGDPNPANFMLKDGKLYIIDYGFAKITDTKLQVKLKTKTPNKKFMILGFILKCKESFGDVNYSHLKKFLTKEERLRFNL